MCSSAGRAAVSKAAGRGFESLRTRSESFYKRAWKVVMEVKAVDVKKPARTEAAEASLKRFKVREWVEQLKQEIKSIQWTTQDELVVYTKIVVAATFLFGMGVYLIDLVIHSALNLLTWVSRLLVG